MEALCHVDDTEVSTVLGFPLITKAEPYTAQAQALRAQQASTHTNWLIGAVVVSSILALVILLALLLLLHRYKREETKHKRLLTSPGPSSQGDHNQPCSLSPDGSVSTNTKVAPLSRGFCVEYRTHFLASRLNIFNQVSISSFNA